MARPHLEFIHAQIVPWQRGLEGGARSDVEARVLSRDPDHGGCTAIVRYPPGWRRAEPEHLKTDEEFIVLDGAIEIGGVGYGKMDYGHLPAGFVRDRAKTAGGAVALTFFSTAPIAARGPAPAGLYDERRLVRHLDTRRMAGVEGMRKIPGVKTTAVSLHRRLKTDPATGELTWLVAIRGGWQMSQMETHSCIEEEFTLSGDMVGPKGTMRPGAYFWRPAGIQHGPFATATGTIHLVRSIGGEYKTDLVEKPGPFNWDQAYDPVLPPPYDAYARGYVDREVNY
jgi:hypothetical protein